MFNNIFQAKFSLKAIFLLSSIILFSCEDKDEDKEAVVPINGTFKLSPESYDCEGLEAVEYLTIDSIFVNIYNDLDDECHESDDTQTDLCYELTTNYVERDGNDLSFTDEGEKISLSSNSQFTCVNHHTFAITSIIKKMMIRPIMVKSVCFLYET